MSLGASEYSLGCAQNTARYVQNLIKREGKTAQNREEIVRDLCQKSDRFTFSSRPGKRQLEALLAKFGR